MNKVEQLASSEALSVENKYKLLVGHKRTDGSIKTDEQLRSQYIELTDNLINRITEGATVYDEETGESKKEPYDYIVWLDKSARPVSWLTKELWPILAASPDPGGNRQPVPQLPEFKYINIDREQWVNQVDPNGVGRIELDRVDDSVIRSLRSIFMRPEYKRGGLTDSIDNYPSEFDGKNILIVDEVLSTGRTLSITKKFFGRAFPSAHIEGTHWMKGVVQKDTAIGNADLPVWYDEKKESGRGVGNRDDRKSLGSGSLTQRLGAQFLSTAQSYPDKDAQQLRREFSKLAEDARNHEVLVVPSLDRGDRDYDARATALNGLSSLNEFVDKRHKMMKR